MTDVKIKVTFVIPKHCKDENDCSEDMLIAYTTCENHRGGGLKAQWAHEESITFNEPFTKSDIFVLTEFEGELYEKLKATKCLLVGPRCLSCSLTEGSSIPTKGHPVYTIAMRGLIVSLSGLSKELKTSLKQKIEWMGGTYSAVLSSDTTHLIANNVFSDKYTKAVERGIPVMKESWVDAVWEASLKLDINGASSEFDTHRLPPFANLQITTSGLNSSDKKLVMKLVNANGGDFSRVFLSQTTNVLVLTKESTTSEKYKAAIEFGKVCVTPHWVKDSAALGFALPVSRYKVTSTTTSSPVRDRQVPDMSLNLTRITRDGKPSNFVDDSKMAESMMLSGTSKIQRDSKRDSSTDEIQNAFEAFDVASIKKAGPIFDGFCIWVTGLDGMPRDRAWACVSKAGGTRYDEPNGRVTHAVSWGPAAVAAAAALPAVPVLSPLWLIRSVEAGRVLDEAEFVINTEPVTPRKLSQPPLAAASPMSKRSLQLLLPPRDQPVTEEPQRDHLVDHYLSQHLSQAAEANNKSPEPVERNEPSKNDEKTAVTESELTQSENIFKDLVFEVQGLEDEAICEIGAEIRAEGGVLAAAGAGGTHVLVPLDFDTRQLVTETAEAVTVFWVKDCLSRQALTPIEYYHRPVQLKSPNANPLSDVVASLSTYSGVERAFLDEVAKLCGATMQQRFCRRSNNSALASTHLICPEPTGAKYSAARKWGVPVVRASWLLACADTGRRVDEAEHSVDQAEGDSTSAKQNTLVNPPPPITPEPKKNTPEPRPTTPEPEKRTSESVKKPDLVKTPEIPEPRSKTPESAAHEDVDANLVEQMLPPDVAPNATSPRQTRKFKKINNKNELFEGMSPASRFISMHRMGLFSDREASSKENTPKKPGNDSDASLNEAAGIQSPPIEEALSSPNLRGFSPNTRSLQAIRRGEVPDDPIKTPVNPSSINEAAGIQSPPIEEMLSSPNLRGFSPNTRRILQAIRRGEVPDEPMKTPVNPFDKKIKTPDSAFGAILCPGIGRMSVDSRKRLWKFVDELPTNEPRRRDSGLETPQKTPVNPFDKKIETPDSAFGAILCPGIGRMSVDSRKRLWDFVDELPTNEPRRRDSGLETPPSKIAKLTENRCAGGAKLPEQVPPPPQTPLAPPRVPQEVDEQLQRLNVVLTGRRTPRRASRALQAEKPADMEYESGPESQPNTVGWDDTTPSQKDSFESLKPQCVETVTEDKSASELYEKEKNAVNVAASKMEVELVSNSLMAEKAVQTKAKVQAKTVKRFMLSSNVDNREETVEMILRLGGEVTDLDEEEEGSPATHLLCCAPARSQRVLNCIAAGRWVLHPAYAARSAVAGAFLQEEEFEWGNPLATCLPPVTGGERVLAVAAHRWRTRRAKGQPGPFAGVVALLHAPEQRRKLLARLVKAGEGTVVDEDYFWSRYQYPAARAAQWTGLILAVGHLSSK